MTRARPDSNPALLGTWKLRSFTTDETATGLTTNLFGIKPHGYLYYGADFRMYAILVAYGRKAPADLVPTDMERIELFNGLCSYAGSYDIAGDEVRHHIDVSWNQSWTGTTQVRRFRINGNCLHITTLPARNPVTGNECVSVLLWDRLT
ncbi:lipocalin-like domain-containing protein [Paraburkholderia bannensis]|uniref:lipocalin-like domain-containing protein n=1 Tax=Paraburkholderia bannensis TaxID=765414 RepID=UPI002AB7A448|nr:lipocalin-like domain-containing protein [Paraburkholderia bannensis]